MSGAECDAEFPPTSWALVRIAAGDSAARNELCERYVRPAYAFLRGLGCARDVAEDLVQAFFAEHVLAGAFLDRVCEERGSFRSYLRTSLANFRIDIHRRQRGRDGRRPRVESISDPAMLDGIDALVADRSPDEAFDLAWAHGLLDQALSDAERECRAKGQSEYWEAFEAHRILPVRRGAAAASLAELGASFGIDAKAVSDRIETVRRRVLRHFERRSGVGCADAASRAEECAHARSLLVGKVR